MKPHRAALLFALTAALTLAWGDPGQVSTLAEGKNRPLESVSWVDVDLDGRLEFLVVRPDGSVSAVRETEGGLVDGTEELGLSGIRSVARLLWSDADGDRDSDLLVLARDGSARLLANERNAGFRDATAESGLDLASGLVDAAWQDFDADGAEDLFLVRASGASLYRNLGGLAFEASGVTAFEPLPSASEGLEGVPATAAVAIAEPEPVPAGGDGGDGTSTTGSAAPGRLSLTHVDRAVRHSGGSEEASGPPTTTKVAGITCAKTIDDKATANCIPASSVPQLGSLYPISSDLFVEQGTGRVGVNTTNPEARLDVDAGNGTGISVHSGFAGSSLMELTSLSTSPFDPTLFAKVGDGGVSGYFQEKLQVGTLFTGLPAPRATLGIDDNDNAELRLSGTVETVELVAAEAAGNGAQLDLRMASGQSSIILDAEFGAGAAEVSLFEPGGTETVQVRPESSVTGQGGQLALRRADGVNTVILESQTTRGAELSMQNPAGLETVEIISDESGGGAQMTLFRGNGFPTIQMDAQQGPAGVLTLTNANAIQTVVMTAEEVAGNGAQLVLKKFDGTEGIVLDAEQGVDSRITTDTLLITGGADLVEGFRTDAGCAPGSVVVIDATDPGALTLSGAPYDPRVAGVVSGAGGVKPGIRLGQREVLDGDTPVALSGRVYVRCNAENGSIEPGDLLTSSSTPGQAMRATDPERSFGAVIGKAMGSLEGESGLVLVLVGLQ